MEEEKCQIDAVREMCPEYKMKTPMLEEEEKETFDIYRVKGR